MEEKKLTNYEMIEKAFREHLNIKDEAAIEAKFFMMMKGLL